MAGDWIKMRADLHTHPKIVRITSALKADRLRTVGALHAVWCLFDAHSEDGLLEGYTIEVLDNYLSWKGFSEAMVEVEWLEVGAKNLHLPRFDSHNGQSAKRRAQDSERKRNERKVSAPEEDKNRTREEKRREEKNITTRRFTPPTLDEIKTVIIEKGYTTVDPDVFFNHYESNGWKVGKNKMVSYVKALAGWHSREGGDAVPKKSFEERHSDRSWAE